MSPRVPETPVYSTCQLTLVLVQDLLSVEVGGALADSGEEIKTLLSSPFIVFAEGNEFTVQERETRRQA